MQLPLKSATIIVYLSSTILLIIASILKCTLAADQASSVSILKPKSIAMATSDTADTTMGSSSKPATFKEKTAHRNVKSSTDVKNAATKLLEVQLCVPHHIIVPAEQLECFADYLVLAKSAKTEIFAEKGKKWWLPAWRMKRAVVRQNKIKLRLYEREMAADIGKRRADECFTRNREVLHTQKVKGTDKVEIFVQIWKIFDRSANGRLQVSDGLNKRLEEQSSCLMEFLIQNYGVDHVHEEVLEKVHDHGKEDNNSDVAVLKAYSVNGKAKKLLRWKWALVGEEAEHTELRQSLLTIGFERGNAQFNALEKCEKIVPLKNSRDERKEESSFLALNPLLARFREDQLFVREMPKTRNNLIIHGHLQLAMLKQQQCTICLEDYEVNDELQQFYPCQHAFHKDCVEKWLNIKGICPLCKATTVELNWFQKLNIRNPFETPTPEQAQQMLNMLHNDGSITM